MESDHLDPTGEHMESNFHWASQALQHYATEISAFWWCHCSPNQKCVQTTTSNKDSNEQVNHIYQKDPKSIIFTKKYDLHPAKSANTGHRGPRIIRMNAATPLLGAALEPACGVGLKPSCLPCVLVAFLDGTCPRFGPAEVFTVLLTHNSKQCKGIHIKANRLIYANMGFCRILLGYSLCMWRAVGEDGWIMLNHF